MFKVVIISGFSQKVMMLLSFERKMACVKMGVGDVDTTIHRILDRPTPRSFFRIVTE